MNMLAKVIKFNNSDIAKTGFYYIFPLKLLLLSVEVLAKKKFNTILEMLRIFVLYVESRLLLIENIFLLS